MTFFKVKTWELIIVSNSTMKTEYASGFAHLVHLNIYQGNLVRSLSDSDVFHSQKIGSVSPSGFFETGKMDEKMSFYYIPGIN